MSKKAKKTKKPQFILVCYYEGYDREKDRKIESAVGTGCSGGGCGFGERDLDWWFKTEKGATNAMNKLKAAKIRGVKGIKIYTEQEYCGGDWE